MSDTSFLQWPFFTAEHRQLATALDTWAVSQLPDPLNEQGDVDQRCLAILKVLGEGGWTGYAVPVSGGGRLPALDVRTLCLIRETLGRYHPLADFVFAMQGLGSGPISLFGSEAQQQHYLPAVAAGKTPAAFALSEPEAGSDVAAITTTAVEVEDGYLLNGEKTWISNAGIAGTYTVFARTGEGSGAKGLSCFIVEADTPGFEVSKRIELMAPHPLGSITFSDCKIPKQNLVGVRGKGFSIAMATLDVFRSTVGAAALGFARRALDETLMRVSTRKLFGGTLGDLQIVQGKVGDMALEVDASALLVYRAAWVKDCAAQRVTREAAMAKLYSTEAAQRVIDTAVQLHGGAGVSKGNMVESLYRDIRALRIYEGASEVQQTIIARQILASFEGR